MARCWARARCPPHEAETQIVPRALVIGGSVGGLFAACLLREIGWDVAVFEKSAGDLSGRGAGLGLSSELFAVMRRAGVE